MADQYDGERVTVRVYYVPDRREKTAETTIDAFGAALALLVGSDTIGCEGKYTSNGSVLARQLYPLAEPLMEQLGCGLEQLKTNREAIDFRFIP